MEISSFRDSSNIEFSADVLMGIQIRNMAKRLSGVDEKKRTYMAAKLTDEEKAKTVRELEIVGMKNRGGELFNGEHAVKTYFYAALNAFSEAGWKGF